MSVIHVPGRGAMDLDCRRVDLAVNEYDERLFAARHPNTNDPSVFIKMSPFTDWMLEDFGLEIGGQKCMPVLAFPLGFPEPHEVIARLRKADSLRRGTAILKEINDTNASLRAQAAYVQAEAAGQVAEVAESVAHREGRTPHKRSLPKRDPKQRSGR